MTSEQIIPEAPSAPEPEPAPELADWWVWGMRKVAALFAEWLMISRGFLALFMLIKLGYWYFTRDTRELYLAGAGAAAVIGVWGIGRLLGRFAWARESPDPERWLAQRRTR